MAIQSPDFHARLLALHLDEEECEEAEYHRFLVETARPVDKAAAALRQAAAAGQCSQWAAENHEVFQQAADALRASQPPTWLAVYRDQLLKGVEVFLRATDEWRGRDPVEAASCAARAEEAWREAEDLEEGLL